MLPRTVYLAAFCIGATGSFFLPERGSWWLWGVLLACFISAGCFFPFPRYRKAACTFAFLLFGTLYALCRTEAALARQVPVSAERPVSETVQLHITGLPEPDAQGRARFIAEAVRGNGQTFRLLVQDLAGQWTVEALSDELSQLADTVLRQTLHHAWHSIPKIHRPDPQFIIIGYGKLGGKELGYTSDLDLVYLYDDPHPEAADLYTKLARRLTTWLSSSTGAGSLYELDLRLRPNGDSGFLVHSLAAYTQYQQQNAWTWEHQSLTRARYICGSAELGAQFEQLRRQIIAQPRNIGSLKTDIIAMRHKTTATPPADNQNVKYARGGVVDVEFIVQYLVLAESGREPKLTENYGNIALLGMAARRGLIDPDLAQRCADAYRHYRQLQHNKNLRDLARTEINDELRQHYQNVQTLWQQVFGEPVRFEAQS
mgnify:CR=1 FL=1